MFNKDVIYAVETPGGAINHEEVPVSVYGGHEKEVPSSTERATALCGDFGQILDAGFTGHYVRYTPPRTSQYTHNMGPAHQNRLSSQC